MAELSVQAEISVPTAPTILVQGTDTAANEALKLKAAQLMELLTEEEYAAARESISEELAEKLSAQQIEQIWENLIIATGSVKKFDSSKVINTVNADLVFITAEFEDSTDDFIVTFNQEGEVTGIDFPKIDPIDRIAEIFVNALANNDYPRARGFLHPFLKVEIFPQRVRSRWQELLQQTGRVKKVGKPQINPGSKIVLVPIEFEKTEQSLFITFDDDRRITNVDIPQL